ncbi:T9SS type A sorting domain-containing protein [bacterium SCSIO 12741]|nr:T9SS type A sorting domain-containing protein [bacterium SCSIO 12741]
MKKTIFTLAIGLLTANFSMAQTIYTVSDGGDKVMDILNTMVSETRIPASGTVSSVNTVGSHATVATTHNSGTNISMVYSDIHWDYVYTNHSSPQCSTQAAMNPLLTVAFARYRQMTGGNGAGAHLILDTDPALTSNPYVPYYYYWHPRAGQPVDTLDPINVLGHHNHPGPGCNPRNHVIYYYLVKSNGDVVHFGDVANIDHYEMEHDFNKLPTTNNSPSSSVSTAINNILTNAATFYASEYSCVGYRVNVTLFNGSQEQAYLLGPNNDFHWKNKYDPCPQNDPLDCNFFGVNFNDPDAEIVHFDGPTSTRLSAISVKPLRYDWDAAGSPMISQMDHIATFDMSMMGHTPVTLDLFYEKHNQGCYHVTSVTNTIYFPGGSCNVPPPPAAPNGPQGPAEPSSVGEETSEMEPVLVYPNPTDGVFTVQSQKEISISVLGINGQQVSPEVHLGNGMEMSVDLTTEPAGIYILNITDKDGSVTRKKLIVE